MYPPQFLLILAQSVLSILLEIKGLKMYNPSVKFIRFVIMKLFQIESVVIVFILSLVSRVVLYSSPIQYISGGFGWFFRTVPSHVYIS